jgi:repressor LexA
MYERYLEVMNEKGVRHIDVSRATGIPPSTFSDWKKGKSSPKTEKLQKLADYFGVQLDYLTGESEFKTKQEMIQHFKEYELKEMESNILQVEHGVRIPVLGQVAAGTPIFAQENYVEYEEISATLARTGEFFGLRIKGDSMAPKISEGDVVIVRQQSDADSGDIVIVLINGDFATCKKLMKYKDGISLISFNPSYEPMTFTEEDVRNIPVRIIGRVVENRQKY